MSKFTSLFLCVVVLTSAAYGITDEDKKAFLEAIGPVLAECSKTQGITQEQLQAAQVAGTSAGLGPCFISCVLKKSGVINPQGQYDVDVALVKLKEFLPKSQDFAKFQEVVKICAKVNDQAVTDGDAGCDRAKLVTECFRENKAAIPL